MPDATQKLALEIEAQSEKALSDLDKVKKSINQTNKSAEASIAVDKKVVTTQQAMTRSSASLTTAQRKAGYAIGSTSTDLKQMVGALTEGDQTAQKFTGTITSGVSTLLTMGPAAAGVAIGIGIIQQVLQTVSKQMEAVRIHDVWAQTRKGTQEWARGLADVRKELQNIENELDENQEALAKWQRRLKVMTDDTITFKDVWIEFAYGIGHVAYKIDDMQKKTKQNQVDLNTGTAEYVRMVKEVAQTGIVQSGHIKDVESGLEAINNAYKWGIISLERQNELLVELQGQWTILNGNIDDWNTLLDALGETEEKRQAKVSTGINKRAELEKRLRDELMQLTMEVYDYKLARLREDYTEHAKIVRDKELLERWFTEQELAIYAERYDTEMRLAEQAFAAAENLIDQKLAIQDRFNEDLMRMTMDSTDFQIMQLEDQVEAFRKAGVEETKIDEWKTLKIAEIQDKAEEERVRKAQQVASSLVADSRAAFAAMGQALQETLDWQISMEQQYGVKSKSIAEMRKKALQAAAWEQVKESIKALAWEQVQKAVAFAIAGLWVKAGQHAAAAAALGAGAVAAGHFAATRRSEVESMQTAFERQQAALREERDAQREAEERAREPGKERGPRETGPRITHSTFNFNFEIWNIFHGDIIGYHNFERKLAGSIRAIAMRGKLDWMREIK